jgi:hypothetical protein
MKKRIYYSKRRNSIDDLNDYFKSLREQYRFSERENETWSELLYNVKREFSEINKNQKEK